MSNLNILLLVIFLLLLILIAIVLIAQYQYMIQKTTVVQPAGCLGTRWGCCTDGITVKEDEDGTNCADYEMYLRPPEVPTIAMDVQPPQVQVLPTELQKPMTPLKPAMQPLEKPMTPLKPPKGNEKFTNYAFI